MKIITIGPVRTTTKNRVWRLQKDNNENFVTTNILFLQPCSHPKQANFFV